MKAIVECEGKLYFFVDDKCFPEKDNPICPHCKDTIKEIFESFDYG